MTQDSVPSTAFPNTERAGRLALWEIVDCQGIRHEIYIDPHSIDDRLYLLRRIEDMTGTNLNLPAARVRYLGTPR